jgi:intracellular sulfur oxidation DsrE/DsrF family protein
MYFPWGILSAFPIQLFDYGVSMPTSHPRRHFLGRAAAALAALATGIPEIADAAPGRDENDHDAWIKAMRGKHRQFFHAMTAEETPMRMASNFLDAYRDAFKAKDGEVNAVVGIHGAALAIGFNDAAWAKYSMGKGASVIDPTTKEPAVRNVFATGTLGVETLQKRGIVFLMCNTALRARSRQVAAERGETYEAVYADLSASRLPGVILVPAMVVAVNRAQEAGFTYVRT